jgi:hypothetical protein
MSQSGMVKVTDNILPPDVPLQFTTNSGIAVPAANNLNVLGANGTTTSGAGSTITITNPSDLHVARFIVASSTSGTGANFTTIATAITAAVATGINSTIFIQPGTYTENLTLPANINLCSFLCDAFTPNVTIVGTITKTTVGSSSISGIRLQTNSAALLSVTGSAASIVNLNNCFLNCTNATGITFSVSNAAAKINMTNCGGDLGTTGIGLFAHSSSGTMNFYNCNFTNTGLSLAASTCSAGVCDAYYTLFNSATTFSGTSGFTWEYVGVFTIGINTTSLTAGGSNSQSTKWSRYNSGTASAVSIGGTLQMEFCDISSSNTNAVTGAGTLQGNSLNFTGSSSLVNTTTQTALPLGISASWTPNVQINGSNTGITYTSQLGGYIVLGNAVLLWGFVVLSSKGVSSGNVTISNLPVAVSANGTSKDIPMGEYNQVTATGFTSLGLRLANSSVGSFIISSATGSAVTGLVDTQISNTFMFRFSGMYIIN